MEKRSYLVLLSVAAIAIIASAFILGNYSAVSNYIQYRTQLSPNTPISLGQNSAIGPCPALTGTNFYTVLENFSGLENYTLSANGNSYTNLVIAQGKSGEVYYKIIREDYPYLIINSSGAHTMTNKTAINVKNFVTFSNLNPNTNINTLEQTGIRAYISPASENILTNSSASVQFSINISGVAVPNTYQISFGPSFCGGASFLLTIGTSPYSGPLPNVTFPP